MVIGYRLLVIGSWLLVILRASPPAAGLFGMWWLEDGWLECGCWLVKVLEDFWRVVGLFFVSWVCLGEIFVPFLKSSRYLGGGWATCGSPMALQHGPWELQALFFTMLGCHFDGLGGALFNENRALDPCLSMSVFGMVSGRIFDGLLLFQAYPGT